MALDRMPYIIGQISIQMLVISFSFSVQTQSLTSFYSYVLLNNLHCMCPILNDAFFVPSMTSNSCCALHFLWFIVVLDSISFMQ